MWNDLISASIKILFFFIVGSFISFLADNIGKRIGKKKIVLFNLRPKYTAVLITSITGGIIAIISILILSFLSKDARIYLFQMNKIVKQIDFYKNEVKILQNRYTELTRDISILIQTTHMGDIVFVKDQPIYIYSFYNDGNKEQLYSAINNLKKIVVDKYKIHLPKERVYLPADRINQSKLQMKSKEEIYLSNIVRVDEIETRNVMRQITERKGKRLALIFTSKRNIFIGEYVDVNVFLLEDRLLVPADTILEYVEITDPSDIEGNFTLIMNSISKIQENLINKGKLYIPQENSVGGRIPFERIVSTIAEIKEKYGFTKSKRKFKILLINKQDIYAAGSFDLILKIIEE